MYANIYQRATQQQDSDTDSDDVTSSDDEADDESCGYDDYISDNRLASSYK